MTLLQRALDSLGRIGNASSEESVHDALGLEAALTLSASHTSGAEVDADEELELESESTAEWRLPSLSSPALLLAAPPSSKGGRGASPVPLVLAAAGLLQGQDYRSLRRGMLR